MHHGLTNAPLSSRNRESVGGDVQSIQSGLSIYNHKAARSVKAIGSRMPDALAFEWY